MLVNAEGLPLEGIDKIEITLNPELNFFINPQKRNIDPKHYLHLRSTYKYGTWWFLDIQAQFIYGFSFDIRAAIANSIYKLIEKEFIVFPYPVNYQFIYSFLDFFVYEIREIEFYFDIKPEMVKIINYDKLLKCGDTFYSVDRRLYKNKPPRKSILENYDRKEKLLCLNQISHESIITNNYSQRIEFRLTKYNCPYRTLNNLIGSQDNIITKYTPYLAILYHRFFEHNIIINPKDHPHLTNILFLSNNKLERYRGVLEKRKIHKPSEKELIFFRNMRCLKSKYNLHYMINTVMNTH